MPSAFVNFLADYLKKQSENYKTYLLSALKNEDRCISILASSGGVLTNAKDVRNFELLCDAKIFEEKIQFSHSGRNAYKIFCLTDLGLKLALDIKNEGALTVKP
jgi:hypothetical protein